MKISLFHPYVPEAAIQAVSDVLKTKWIGQGPKVEEFEKLFAAYVGRSAVAVGSGTDALHLAYVLAGIGEGDEVIAPLFTCTATNIPLLYCKAKIRFADVSPGSLNVDWHTVMDMITEKTKAVVIVHYGGARVHHYPEWKHYIRPTVPVIEDAAQALGAKVGFADYTCYSFQAIKHVTTGDGGMLLPPEAQVGEARRRRWFGIDRVAKLLGNWNNDIKEIGYKYQMHDIAATMGIEGMRGLKGQLAARRLMMLRYWHKLLGVPGIKLVDYDPEGAAWLCTVLAENREGLKKKLADNDIESDPVHYRNDRYSIFKHFGGNFPNMDAIQGQYLCLPLHMKLCIGDVDRICAVIKSGW
jgi:perosamine synthetase